MKKLTKKNSAKTITAYGGCRCKTSMCWGYYPFTKSAQLAAASKQTRF